MFYRFVELTILKNYSNQCRLVLPEIKLNSKSINLFISKWAEEKAEKLELGKNFSIFFEKDGSTKFIINDYLEEDKYLIRLIASNEDGDDIEVMGQDMIIIG